MVETGRRERKKQRTHQALVNAAMRLFERKGFEQTLVTEIADAADVSERTFYLHFPTKEDVVIGTAQARLDAGLRAIAEWEPGQTVAEVLGRAGRLIAEETWRSDLPSGLAELRVRLLATTPSVQARLVQRLMRTQGELIEALHRAAPESVRRVDAAALVGALLGALNAAAIVSVEQGDDPERIRAALHRAIDLALRPELVAAAVRQEEPAGG
ncbi:TetR/AcrR family transcriptional regulator [Allonocardiopsis opalescens]|uniref:TetR family transcriptional regulator n=1 Tax=Allonocardiopsis opalescens TaxID=1144618 RepID=A0A2T0QEW0_9ACTN|nr:TetR/AcrR family transcriptional regulator [Allonocardiopsis opalescens]PRY02442.1 TetR family transcriptional regulator [Allonocardiopsis opalescens]